MANGGGIHIAAATLTNVTLTGNKAGTDGGGISNDPGHDTVLKNTVVAGAGGANCSGLITSSGNNLDADATCGLSGPGDLTGVDPKLGSLQDNGGPTQTHALLAGSPAIDAADDSACPGHDQRGIARPLDGNGDGYVACDIGSFESNVAPPPTAPPVATTTPTPPVAELPQTGGEPAPEQTGNDQPLSIAAPLVTFFMSLVVLAGRGVLVKGDTAKK